MKRNQRDLRNGLFIGGALGAAALAVAINIPAAQKYLAPRSLRKEAELPDYPAYQKGQRVLFVSPHPDDETLAAGAQLAQAVQNGAEVFIVWITNGDGFSIDALLTERTDKPVGGIELGRTRMKEAQKAGETLGVDAAHQRFMGFPDGSTLRVWEAGLRDKGEVVQSHATRLSAVPYEGTMHPGQPYTAGNMQVNIAELLDDIRPDFVLIPTQGDMHHDHHAANLFWKQALGERGELHKARYWLIHGGLEWPLPKGLMPHFPLLPAPRGKHLSWQKFEVTEGIQMTKLRAAFAHETQAEILLDFMLAFIRKNELVTLEDRPLPKREE